MQHEPYVGAQYESGLNGQKLLLIGFSHYGAYDNGTYGAIIDDHESFTKAVFDRWVWDRKLKFFNNIASYFGYDDNRNFYRQVAFANTLPSTVGDSGNKYSNGTIAQRKFVPDRVKWLIKKTDPDKIIVFTKKGWSLWPWYDDMKEGEDGVLPVPGHNHINYGGYERPSNGFARAYGLRHPQGASFDMMQATVKAVMADEPVKFS